MLMSKYVFKYLCDKYPIFAEKVKLTDKNLIKKQYIDEIYNNESLKKIFLEAFNNIIEIEKIAKEKYKKSPEQLKKYRREYYYKKYNENEEFREKKKKCLRDKYDKNKMIREYKKTKEDYKEMKKKLDDLEKK